MRRTVLRITVLFLATLYFDAPAFCRCATAHNQQTIPGGNEIVQVLIPEPMRSVRGVVQDMDNSGMSNVLVEVIDNPDGTFYPLAKGVDSNRVKECITWGTGAFLLTSSQGNMNSSSANRDGM
ncbi:MAG TPA: hypothetical protein VJR23_18020 [Candidatus Acidoferrales bacterium]|nr:hypothetical protein [Candidatus Acidoferrales bacterium]